MRISDWSSDVCSSDLSCHCRSSLWRSHGEGDRARRAWWRGGAVASLPLRQRFALPPPHGCATGRIIMSATGRTPPSTSLALNASIGTRRESPCGIPSSTAENGCFSLPYLNEGLSPARFAPFFSLDAAGLAAANARRVTAPAHRGFPCPLPLP